jgi:hypothetical protein
LDAVGIFAEFLVGVAVRESFISISSSLPAFGEPAQVFSVQELAAFEFFLPKDKLFIRKVEWTPALAIQLFQMKAFTVFFERGEANKVMREEAAEELSGLHVIVRI